MSEQLERITYVEDEPDIRSITEFALAPARRLQLERLR